MLDMKIFHFSDVTSITGAIRITAGIKKKKKNAGLHL